MITINEQSTGKITLTFRNGNDELIVPATLQYSVTDAISGTFVVPVTAVAPTTSTYDLIITSAQNAIIGSTHDMEERIISALFTYSGGSQATGEYSYLVKRVHMFTSTEPVSDGYDDGGTWP